MQRDARRFRLKGSRLRFVPGFFNTSLPRLVAEEPDVRFAVVPKLGYARLCVADARAERLACDDTFASGCGKYCVGSPMSTFAIPFFIASWWEPENAVKTKSPA